MTKLISYENQRARWFVFTAFLLLSRFFSGTTSSRLMTRITEQESSILKRHTLHKKNWINQPHIPRNPLCLDISSLITYKQTSCVCSVQCLFIPTSLQKNSDWGFLPRTQTEGAQKSFPTCDLMTNYSDSWIFWMLWEHSTRPFRNRCKLVVCISIPTFLLHYCEATHTF